MSDEVEATLADPALHAPWAESTRWIGDAYEAHQRKLGEKGSVKKNALVQTPTFVVGFVNKYNLGKAVTEFGAGEPAIKGWRDHLLPNGLVGPSHVLRMIDPCCGCGHFLADAFDYLFALWLGCDPKCDRRVLSQRTLDSIHGVDIDRMCVALARFRLDLAASNAARCPFLEGTPRWRINVVWGDALLEGNDEMQPWVRWPDGAGMPPWQAGGYEMREGRPPGQTDGVIPEWLAARVAGRKGKGGK